MDPLTSVLGATQGDKDRAKPLAIERPCAIEADASSAAKDLETIVFKALEKEKERRYSSSAELAGDLKRFTIAGICIMLTTGP